MNNRLQGRKKKGTKNIFNKITEENFPNLKKEMLIKVQDAYRISNRQNQKRDFSQHIVIKTPNVQNNEDSVLRSFKGKRKSHIQRQVH